jgi:hypothetical protein
MKRIIDHWTIYYFWIFKFFQKKNSKGAKYIAENLVPIPMLIYLILYIIVPIVLMTQKIPHFITENRVILIFALAAITLFLTGYFLKSGYVKQRLHFYNSFKNWHESIHYKRGRRIVRFHLFFSFASVPILVGLIHLIVEYAS